MAQLSTAGLCLLVCAVVTGQQWTDTRNPKLLMIVLGGFRWDFLNWTMDGGFRMMREEGIKADYLAPVFPSLTSPNLYSLMTGRFPSDHGIIGDRMFDEVTEGWFMDLESSVPQASWWESAEPLWITASRNNLRTELYWWPGCEAGIDGVRPDICEPYKGLQIPQDPLETWKNSLRQTIEKFAQNTVNMVAYYVDHVLITAKFHGINPDNQEFRRAIRNVDNIIREALDNLRIRGLDKEVTVVIASDHGVSEINYQTKIVNLQEYVNENDIVRVIDNGAVYGIDPVAAELEQVYEKLKRIGRPGVRVLKEKEIPSSWHYLFTRRCPDIVVVAEPGTVLRWGGDSNKFVSGRNRWNDRVVSGYDVNLTPDMRGIFFIKGPDFKSGVTHGPFSTTDVYNVISNVLRLQPLPNQGIWNRVKNMFMHPDMFSAACRMTATSVLLGVASGITWFYIRR